MPAASAGDDGTTPATTTPEPVGEVVETWMPRNAVEPTCVDASGRPALIARQIDSARLMEIVRPQFALWRKPKPGDAAVSTPITLPTRLNSGPPDSPGCSCASVCRR